ncbi:DUF3093 domain-containing protein [Oerskovia flava]|uniref:DUF3093 domain-containing protein n=1 Tax=Oerskovia flava TaxID=2986422 RepID=UPI00223FBC04|nr:DUF3093 domain-containing protein [Oerskovia sp. JB1-3-2]
MQRAELDVRHHERLLPGIGGWVAGLAFAAAVGVALWPADRSIAVAVGGGAAVVALALLWWTSPVVTVVGDRFRAGRAEIPLDLLGEVRVLDAEGMRHALGPDLDARSYVCLRSWARTGISVTVTDPDDPTPCWVVSTRRPAELAAALGAA